MRNKFLSKKNYIIAEVGLNHDGNFNLLKKLIIQAKKSGCNAVKIQSLDYDSTEVKKKLDTKLYYKNKKIPLEKLLKKLVLSDKQHYNLSEYCKIIDIDLISTPFSLRHVDLLKKINVKKIKISSQDIVFFELIKKVAKTNKPIIISTGMSSLKEISNAVRLIKKYNNKQITILHCLSKYPSNYSELNLRRIIKLREKFSDCKIGFSDHTLGSSAAVVSKFLGAEVFEKHFTHNKNAEGWDHSMSLDFNQMRDYCNSINYIKKSLGNKNYSNILDKNQRKTMRRSIIAKNTIKKKTKNKN